MRLSSWIKHAYVGGVVKVCGRPLTPRVILMTDGLPTDEKGETDEVWTLFSLFVCFLLALASNFLFVYFVLLCTVMCFIWSEASVVPRPGGEGLVHVVCAYMHKLLRN